jgi:hypothetical protein
MAVNVYYLALLVATCVYAFLRGAAPERIGAAIIAANAILTFVAVSVSAVGYRDLEVGIFILDVLAFLAFVPLALRANRFWPIWVSGFLGLGVLGHLARWAGPEVIPWAYAVVLTIWSYPILAIIALGTFNHHQRVKRLGADPSWSISSTSSKDPSDPTI